MKSRLFAFIFLFWTAACFAESAANRVEKLPLFSASDSWTAGDRLATEPSDRALAVRFSADKEKQTARLMLKEPVPVPQWANGFTFLNINSRVPLMPGLQLLLRDAKGKEFPVPLRVFRSREVGWDTSMLVRWDGRWPDSPTAPVWWTKPVPPHPYTVAGLQFECQRAPADGKALELFFHDFAFTRLAPKQSPFYYQLRAFSFLGELDPTPWISLGELGNPEGDRVKVSWEIRDRYERNPFLAGGETVILDPSQSLPLQLARRLEFPVHERGAYWIRITSTWFRHSQPVPSSVRMAEMRLYVENGEKEKDRPVLAAGEAIPGSLVRIAPGRETLEFSGEEKIPVAFTFPEDVKTATTASVELVKQSTGESLRRVSAPLDAQHPAATLELDLQGIPAGAYLLKAAMESGSRAVARGGWIVGVNDAKGAPATPFPPAPGRATAEEIFKRPTPMFHLWPRVPDQASLAKYHPGKTKRDFFKPFFDQAPQVSNEVEYPLYWRDVELLPGVYDWGEMDAVMELAREKGMRVLISPVVDSKEPIWLPPFYKEEADGNFTIPALNKKYELNILYNWEHVPALQATMMRFVGKLAERYRGHPALQGYSFFYEFGGNLPGGFHWNDGYDPYTVADFRNWAREKYGSVDKLQSAWRSGFKAWKEIVPPPNPPLAETSPAWRLDWWKFRAQRFDEFLLHLAGSIRKVDSRGIVLFDTQFFDDAQVARQLREMGCGMANGGAEKGPKILSSLQYAAEGLQERCESVSVELWSANGPYQLDATLFMMTAGGGSGTHCKAFIDGTKPFDALRKPPYSLDRYEKFKPIWTELRSTVPMPSDVCFYRDISGIMLWKNNFGAISSEQDAYSLFTCLENHLTFGVGPWELWGKSKVLLAVTEDLAWLEQSALERLLAYVRNGGCLVMTAGVGRTNITHPAAPSLLERFGFAPVPAPEKPNAVEAAEPVAGEIFGADAKPFFLRGPSQVTPPAEARSLAFYQGDPGRPAVSWKPFGKGRVAVVWAEGIPAPSRDAGSVAHPLDPPSANLLRDLVKWGGGSLYVDSGVPNLYLNLLKHRDKELYYGLAHLASYRVLPPRAIATQAKYRLPAGSYRVTELISGRDLGELSSEELGGRGIPDRWEPEQVTVYRMEKTAVSGSR